MARSSTRMFRSLFVVVAALLCFAALGATAFAAPGDSAPNATDLGPYLGSSLTTNLAVGSPAPTGFYYFKVLLSAGNTLRVNFMASPAVTNLKAIVFKSSNEIVESVAVSSKLTRLTFVAPTYAMYTVYVGTSSPGAFTVQPAKIGPTYPDPPLTANVGRIAGANRYLTAVQLSQASFPTTASAVVVATGLNFADALAGSGLCGSYDAPLLLTPPGSLPASVAAEVDRLQPKDVFVLGSATAVSEAVFNDLKASGRTVTRIEGHTRFDTAAAIARRIKTHEQAEGRTFAGKAFVVNGMKFPDALTASPFAFRNRWPVLLVNATSIPATTTAVMTELGITESYIIGGPTTVSDHVKLTLPGTKKERLWGGAGTGRLETSDAVAEYAVNHGWGTWSTVGLTTGWNYPDALGGGAYCGKQGGVLLLTQPLYMDDPTMLTMFNHRAAVQKVRLFGSTGAVSGFVFGTAQLILNAP